MIRYDVNLGAMQWTSSRSHNFLILQTCYILEYLSIRTDFLTTFSIVKIAKNVEAIAFDAKAFWLPIWGSVTLKSLDQNGLIMIPLWKFLILLVRLAFSLLKPHSFNSSFCFCSVLFCFSPFASKVTLATKSQTILDSKIFMTILKHLMTLFSSFLSIL